MRRRILTIAPAAPAAAVIVFAVASAFAQGVSDGRAQGAALTNAIEDVQVGEAGARVRVAVICREACSIAPRGSGEFFLPGVSASLDVDLSGRTENLAGLRFTPDAGGAALTIEARARVESAAIRRCVIGEADASCIDIQFAAAGDAVAATATADAQAAIEPRPKPPAPAASERTASRVAAPAALTPASVPGLREAPEAAQLIFANLAPPERFAPPTGAGFAAPRSAPEGGVIDRERAAALAPKPVDINALATEILERNFGVAECGGAEARLRADAWALDAMVDVGFCKAIAGDLDGADAIFARLLEYTPDNYEALVGRAAIAAREGDRGDALDYFQDALNALPPIAESDRIVEAMARI